MKKILVIFLLLFGICSASFANTTPIDFIYLNGSNTNSEKAYKNYVKRVSAFHPVLKSALEKDPFTYEHILKNGQYTIEPTPGEYFWGYKSKEELEIMHNKANLLQGVSPFFAKAFRNTFSDMMHDAIWVRNENNMIPIVEELHQKIMADAKQGKKVVLLGYSAGTFITLEYIMRRGKFISVKEWFNVQNVPQSIKTIMKKEPDKYTCPAAFLATDLARVTPLYKVEPNRDEKQILSAYKNIDKYTEKYCMPDNVVLGVINYASPIPLFYSDLSNPKTDYSNLFSKMYKYIVEQDFFFLTVNFADDPLGFPNDVNYTNEEISKFINTNFKKEQGFLYDYSKNLSCRTVVLAHTSYWTAKKRFAKAVVKGYTEGYNFHYGK